MFYAEKMLKTNTEQKKKPFKPKKKYSWEMPKLQKVGEMKTVRIIVLHTRLNLRLHSDSLIYFTFFLILTIKQADN